ncbi:MAG: hypothetical protein RL660_2380 [Bacteroidota bacterium]|jgi:uncharacterized membrane-anchored protein YitT (DUF2179 family)
MKNERRVNWSDVTAPGNILLTVLGVASAVFAMKGFMIPNAFMDGGITGVSILLHEIYHINISLLILSFNVLFVYLGYRYIGKTFAVQTTIAVVLLSLGLQFIPVSSITSDKLLIAIFGGFFIGIGMGLVIRAGGVIDGAEIVAVFTTKRIGLTVSEIILLCNSLIFLVAATKLGIESAMYSVITYFTATKMCDYIADGVEEFIALNIISAEHERIKDCIVNQFSKGISVYKGERGYLPGTFEQRQAADIVVTIITRLELLKIREAIYDIDPHAFIYVSTVKEARGGILKKKNVH